MELCDRDTWTVEGRYRKRCRKTIPATRKEVCESEGLGWKG